MSNLLVNGSLRFIKMNHMRFQVTFRGLIISLAISFFAISCQAIYGSSTSSLTSHTSTRNDYNEDNNYHLGQQLVKLLYGNQWPLSTYCLSNLTSKEKLTNDAQIESLYNGTYFGKLDGASDWTLLSEKLVASIGIGLKSRQELGILCSANSWGYASAYDEDLSNEPYEDDNECANQLEHFYEFINILTNRSRGEEFRECYSSDSSSVGNVHLERGHRPNLQVSSRAPDGNTIDFKLDYYEQFHSFGRLPSGPPHKQNLLPGDYDACARIKSTRYCVGAYGVVGDGKGREHSGEADAKQAATLYQIGMCLPRVCTSDYVRRSVRHMELLGSIVQMNLLGVAVPQVAIDKATTITTTTVPQFKLNDVFCPPAEDSLYKKLSKDWLSIVLLCLPVPWAFMLLYTTFIRDHTIVKAEKCEQKESPLFDSFDLLKNWQKFINSRELDSRLAGLSAIKTICMIWLMTTHASMTIGPYVKNLNEFSLYYGTTIHGPLVLQGQHVVPSFFIISGLLFGFKYLITTRDYYQQRRQQRHLDNGHLNSNIDFKQMILMRYLRLMPLYLLAWAYVRQFSHLLGNGPLWDSGVSEQSEVRQCLLERFWVPLLMLANFTPPFGHCIMTGWHIANDFQIYLILPLLLLAYRRSRAFGSLITVGTFLASHMTHVLLWHKADNYDLDRVARDPSRFGPRLMLDRMALDYVNPLGRVGTYFLGVWLADLLLSLGEQRTAANDSRAQLNQPLSSADVEIASECVNSKSILVSGGFGTSRRCNLDKEKRSQMGQKKQHDGETRRRSSSPSSSSSSSPPPLPLPPPLTTTGSAPARQMASGEGYQQRKESLLTDNNNNNNNKESSRSSNVLEESFQRHNRQQTAMASGESVRMIDATNTSCNASCGDKGIASVSERRAKFKDTCVLLLGFSTLAFVMFSHLLPLSIRPTFGAYTKAISYPLLRLLAELSWSILLYYLLRGNNGTTSSSSSSTNNDDDQGSKTGARSKGENKNAIAMKMETKMMIMETTKKEQSNRQEKSNRHNQEKRAASRSLDGLVYFLLKMPFWNVLAKLNYALMLTHYSLMRFVIQSQRDLFYFTWVNFSQLTIFLILSCYLLALVVHLTIEMPLTALVQRFVFVAARLFGSTRNKK